MRKLFTLILTLLLALCMTNCAAFAEATLSDDIVILYTNDVHTYIDSPISYDVIAGVKQELQKQYKHVLLVDAGDHIQGTAYGSLDKGESIIKLMNAAGYDLATLGNHEFDYGMNGCINIREWAQYPYVSCNFYNEEFFERKDNVLPSYVLFDCGAQKVAIIGVTTPESFHKSTPAYFQNEQGEYIYGISGGENGEQLQADLQAAIDFAVAEGATTVIALGHLGVDRSSLPWTSEVTIAAVSGLDAFIDGHSHSKVKGMLVPDKDGNDVLLAQTGEYFERIGMMVIDANTGAIATDFIEPVALTEKSTDKDGKEVETVVGYELASDLYTGAKWVSDETVAAIKDGWIAAVDEKLGAIIGSATVTLDNYDADSNRLVRKQETNSGDFAADALYYLFDDMGLDVDIAIMNGGGIRNKAVTGDISYKVCKNIHTFGNVACLQTITGQQLLDALEWGARYAGTEKENGGFLHVSGITYKIDVAYPQTVVADDKGVWVSGPTAGYRVMDVMVYNKETGAYEPLDLAASYNLAGYNYTLRDLGDGFAMFDGAVNVLDYVLEDYMVLANYVQGFEGGNVAATNSPLLTKYPGMKLDYSTPNGSGRIEIANITQ